jgi:antitoxin ParD1/3/4
MVVWPKEGTILATLNISLPEEMRKFIEAQVAEGGYASASEYLRSLIREAQAGRAKRELEAKLREALEGGPATPMAREDWDGLERRVWERHHQEPAKP